MKSNRLWRHRLLGTALHHHRQQYSGLVPVALPNYNAQMGRKGLKAFLKGARNTAGAASDDDEQSQQSTEAKQPAPAPDKEPTPAAKEPASATSLADDNSDDDSDSPKGESRGKMLQRHKREMQAHKKAMDRLGKAKKDQVTKLTKEIEDRHQKELREVESKAQAASASTATAEETPSVSAATVGLDSLALGDTQQAQVPTKAQKRREKQVRSPLLHCSSLSLLPSALATPTRNASQPTLC